MNIDRIHRTNSPRGPRARRGVADDAFPAPETAPPPAPTGPAPTNSAGPAAAIDSVDALMALQGDMAASDGERARARAEASLDALDEMRVALLEGREGAAAARRLAERVKEERTHTDDPALEALLNAVDVRAAVELAKRGLA